MGEFGSSTAFDILEDRRTGPVLWVTQPPMRDADLDDGIDLINEVAADVIEDPHQSSPPIDIWELFGGAAGYDDRITGPDGETITARVSDGVHRVTFGCVVDRRPGVRPRSTRRWTFVS